MREVELPPSAIYQIRNRKSRAIFRPTVRENCEKFDSTGDFGCKLAGIGLMVLAGIASVAVPDGVAGFRHVRSIDNVAGGKVAGSWSAIIRAGSH